MNTQNNQQGNNLNTVPSASKVTAQIAESVRNTATIAALAGKYGTRVTRAQIKEYEKDRGVTLRWVSRRESPVQSFRTPLGLVRVAGVRGTYAIPVAVAVAEVTRIRTEEIRGDAAVLTTAPALVLDPADFTTAAA